jgi:hypothetical protein
MVSSVGLDDKCLKHHDLCFMHELHVGVCVHPANIACGLLLGAMVALLPFMSRRNMCYIPACRRLLVPMHCASSTGCMAHSALCCAALCCAVLCFRSTEGGAGCQEQGEEPDWRHGGHGEQQQQMP